MNTMRERERELKKNQINAYIIVITQCMYVCMYVYKTLDFVFFTQQKVHGLNVGKIGPLSPEAQRRRLRAAQLTEANTL